MNRASALATIGGLLAVSSAAEAYVDPGTGTLVVQVLLAALAGSLFYVRRAITWVRRLLGLEPRAPENSPDPPDPPTRAQP